MSDETILPFKRAKREFEKGYVQRILKRTGGNVSAAARIARKDRKDFHDLMRRCGVDANVYRERKRPRP